MSATRNPHEDRIEERLTDLEREERELERRTDGYQWNHGVALVTAVFAFLIALAALVVAVNANHRRSSSAMAGAMSSLAAGSGQAAGAAANPALPVAHVTLSFKPDAKRGSDGGMHDAAVPSADVTVKAGQTVRMTVYNYDDMPHTFTSPGLARGAAIPASMQQMQGTAQDLKVMPAPGIGVNSTTPGGSAAHPSKTVVTFTAPSTPGSYVWYCRLPCDAWAMAHYGYMRGHVIVTRA